MTLTVARPVVVGMMNEWMVEIEIGVLSCGWVGPVFVGFGRCDVHTVGSEIPKANHRLDVHIKTCHKL